MEEEEEKGSRFAEVAELMEDLTFYTGEIFFPFNFSLPVFYKWKYYPVMRVLAAMLYWVSIPIVFLYLYINNGMNFRFFGAFIVVIGIWLVHLVTFFACRGRKRKAE